MNDEYTSLNENATFAITADSGILEWQSNRLVESLQDVAPNSNIVIFIPSNSVPEMATSTIEYFESIGTVVYGDIPLPEYPISAFLQAFVEASQRFTTEYVVALDTDTIFTDTLSVPQSDADVWVRPADVGAQYWFSTDAEDDWNVLYEHFEVPKPTKEDYVTTVIDHHHGPPYWNSGVVVTRDSTLAMDWMSITQSLAEDESLPVSDDEFFLDQISLALATQSREVCQFDVRRNYPLGGCLRVPSDVQLIHYGNSQNLSRIMNPSIRNRLRTFNAIPEQSVESVLSSLLEVASFKSGQVLSYEQKSWIRSNLESVRDIRNIV